VWSGHSCPLPLPLTLMSSPRWVPHFSRGLCARSGEDCINLLRPGIIPNARAFTSGRRDLPRTCSIPRSEARHQSQAGTSKTLSKGRMSQFQNLPLWKTPEPNDLRNSSAQPWKSGPSRAACKPYSGLPLRGRPFRRAAQTQRVPRRVTDPRKNEEIGDVSDRTSSGSMGAPFLARTLREKWGFLCQVFPHPASSRTPALGSPRLSA